MDNLKKKLLFLIPLILLLLRFSPLLFGYEARSTEEFNVFFMTDSTLGFQNYDKFVFIEVTSGNMNSSLGSCYLYSGGGYFRFTSNETVSIEITFNVSRVKVNGVPIDSGASRSYVQNDYVNLEWDITIQPLLPLIFIFGVIGLVSLFAGPLYTIHGIKKRGINQQDFLNGMIVTVVGFCLVLAWLW